MMNNKRHVKASDEVTEFLLEEIAVLEKEKLAKNMVAYMLASGEEWTVEKFKSACGFCMVDPEPILKHFNSSDASAYGAFVNDEGRIVLPKMDHNSLVEVFKRHKLSVAGFQSLSVL